MVFTTISQQMAVKDLEEGMPQFNKIDRSLIADESKLYTFLSLQ
jgi:hypothetical protein